LKLVAIHDVFELGGGGIDCILGLTGCLVGLTFVLEIFVVGQIANGLFDPPLGLVAIGHVALLLLLQNHVSTSKWTKTPNEVSVLVAAVLQWSTASNSTRPAEGVSLTPGRNDSRRYELGRSARATQITKGFGAQPDQEVSTMGEHPQEAEWNVADWHGKTLVDRDGQKIGKLEDVYVDVENDEPQFGTIKEGLIGRHLTFVPLGGITVGPDELQVAVSKEQVKSAPNIELHGEELSQADESALYHHFELNYTPPNTESGRRLARR
jgi:hypothetical protein